MKKLIALLLVAVMCLSFVACNNGSGDTETPPSGENTENNGGSTNDTNNQGGENNGNNLEKIERGTITTSENPLLPILFQTLADEGWSYTFNEDGTCADQVYWWIENDSENSMTIMVASEYKWKYQIGIVYSAPYLLIQADDAMYMGDDFVAWQPPMEVYQVPYSTIGNFGSLCDTWYANDSSKATIQTVVIKSSGKCVLDEQVATWDYYTDGSNEPDQLDIVISIGEKEVYLGVLIGEDVFWLMPMDGSIGGEYSKAGN